MVYHDEIFKVMKEEGNSFKLADSIWITETIK